MQSVQAYFTKIFKVFAIAFLGLLFVFFFSAQEANAVAGINRQINFQGKLVNNPAKTNVTDTSYTVVFTIYDRTSGGTALWTESQTVTTADGIFRVSLGSVTAFPANFNFNWDGLYLGVKLNSDSEMTPRVQLAAVPYAFNSEKVSGLTVQDDAGNASTSGTLKVANAKTITFSNGLTFAGTDSTTITFQGTDTYVGRTTTDTLTNKTIGSTGLTFSGAATDITTASNEDLTLTPNGSGKLVLTSDFDTAVMVGASTNTPAVLSVRGGTGNNAAFIVDNLNNGNLIAASASGVGKFSVDTNGLVTAAGGLTLTSGAITLGGVTGSGSCLLGGATASWGSCSAGAGSNWDIANGTITPKLSSTLDLLIGGTASNAAKFAVLNINSGTPVASVSSGTQGLALQGDGTIQSVRNNTLTLGGATTGNIAISPNNGGAGSVLTLSSINQTWTGTTTVTATSLATITSAATLGISATALNLGGGSAATLGTTSNANLTIAANGTGNQIISSDFDSGTTIGSAITGEFPLLVRSGIGNNAALAIDQLNITGNLIVASAAGTTKFSVDANGNLGLAGSAVSSTNYITSPNFSVTTGGALTAVGVDSGSGLLQGTGGITVTGTAQINATLTGATTIGNSSAGALSLAGSTITLTANGAGNDITANLVDNNTDALDIQEGTNNYININTTNTAEELQFGNTTTNPKYTFLGTGIASLSGTLDVHASLLNFTTGPIATISGKTASAVLVINNNNTGDLIAASASGGRRFTVDTNGNLGLAGSAVSSTNYITATNFNVTTGGALSGLTGLTLASGAITLGGSTGSGLCINGGATAAWGSCGSGGGGGSNWTLSTANGTLSPNNNTLDLLIGGTASNAAKFAVINVNNSASPIASLSATTASGGNGNGLVFGADATIQSLRKNKLTIGGTTTGDIHFHPGALTNPSLFLRGNGDIGIGTNNISPLASLDIRVNTANSGGTQAIASVSGRTSFAALVANNSGAGDIFTASSSGLTRFTVQQNGAVVIGSAANGLTFDPVNGGPTYSGTGRITKTLTLSPEYAGAVLTASGSATTNGSMTSDASTSANLNLGGITNNFLTYYEWNSSQTSLQDYTVALRATLPADFSSWAPGGTAMQIAFNTELTTNNTSKLDVLISDMTSGNVVYRQAQTSSTAKTWTTVNISANDLSDTPAWNTASRSAMIYLKMYSKDNNHVQVGDIILNYLSKF